MAAFSNGTVANITLDEWDTLTVTGVARLQVTVTGRPQFETATTATLTFGPYGSVTTVILNGQGNGTYLQAPSNIPIPMFMVDVSAAQIAAPTAAQLAATNYLYQLNAQPYTIYQSNGTALVAIGAGGGSTTLQNNLNGGTPGAAALDAAQGPNIAAVVVTTTMPAGAVAITHALHLGNHISKLAGTATGTFAATATSGAVDGDVFEVGVGSAGSFTAAGAITAPTGFKLTAGAGETFTARYDAAADAFYSTTLATGGTNQVKYLYGTGSVALSTSMQVIASVTLPAAPAIGTTIRGVVYARRGTTQSSTWQLRYGPTVWRATFSVQAAAAGSQEVHFTIICYGTNQQMISGAADSGASYDSGSSGVAAALYTINNSAALTLTFEAQGTVVGDTMTAYMAVDILTP